MKVTNIADASKCAKKLAEGKACTVAELKATVRLLNDAMKASRTAAKIAKREAREAKEMLGRALGRLGL